MTRWMLGLACCLCLLTVPAIADDAPPAVEPPAEDVMTDDLRATLEKIATAYDSDRTLLTSIGDEIAIHHHTIVANLDPAANMLTATSTESVTASMETKRIHFLLFHDFAIESIAMTGADGVAIPVKFESTTLQSDTLIDNFMPEKDEFIFNPMLTLSMIRAQAMRRQIVTITLPRLTRMHEDFSVTTTYHGSVSRMHMDPFTTESVMLPATDFWFPDVLGPLSTCDITITLPETYHAFAPGKLLTDVVTGTSRTMHYHSDVKQGEIDVIAGPYVFTKEVHNGLDYYSFLFPKTAEHAMETPALTKAAEYVDFFANLVGPYPYEAFALVETDADTATGHPGFTLIGGHVINAHLLEPHTLGHEILHSWFGNWVYWGGEGGNWSEGITFYLANLYYGEVTYPDGEAWARAEREKALEDVSYITRWNDRTLPTINEFVTNEDSLSQAVGYHKLGMLIHGWRRTLGDDAFFAMLKSFVKQQAQEATSLQDFTGCYYDALKTEGKIASGTDRDDWLARYTRTWYDTRTLPTMSLGKIELARDESNGHYVGVGTVGSAAFPPFGAPPLQVQAYDDAIELLVEIVPEPGASFFDMISPNRTVILDTVIPWAGDTAATTFDFPTLPHWIEFDPNYDQLRWILDTEKAADLRFLFHTGGATVVSQEATLTELNSLANLGAVFGRAPIEPGFATPLTATPDVVHDQNLFAVGTVTDLPWMTDLFTGPYGINEDVAVQNAAEPIIDLGDNDAIFRAWKNPNDPLTCHAVAIGKDVASLAALLKKLPFYPMESEIDMQGGEVVAHHRVLPPTRSLRFPQG